MCTMIITVHVTMMKIHKKRQRICKLNGFQLMLIREWDDEDVKIAKWVTGNCALDSHARIQ